MGGGGETQGVSLTAFSQFFLMTSLRKGLKKDEIGILGVLLLSDIPHPYPLRNFVGRVRHIFAPSKLKNYLAN